MALIHIKDEEIEKSAQMWQQELAVRESLQEHLRSLRDEVSGLVERFRLEQNFGS